MGIIDPFLKYKNKYFYSKNEKRKKGKKEKR
jgi:hypothetical protein